MAKENGLNYQAIFRGIDPQEALGLSTKNGLIADGVDVTNLKPTQLEKKDVNNAYKVVTLDCALPDSLNKGTIKWAGIEWKGDYLFSKKQIALKVDSLITTLPKVKL